MSTLARALVSAHPERCLWASHWPHPTRVPPASDADLLRLLHESAPDAGVRRRILVDNAMQAYDF